MRPPVSITTPRPRWRRLYAIASLAVAAFALTDLSMKPSTLRIVLGCAAAVAGWSAILIWIRANRAALDQLEWCDCAAKTVTGRVIESCPARPEDRAAGAVVVAAPGLELEAREPSATASR